MKKFLQLISLTIFAFFIILLSTNTAKAASYQAYITGNAVNLRKIASTKNSDILNSLNKGYIVTVLDSNKVYDSAGTCSSGWLKVSYNGTQGYVCSQYVSTEQVATEDNYDRPWNTPYKAIVGGAKWIGNGYISKGQFTSYLKKYNVNPSSSYSVYNHQYQTNIAAPASEAISSWKAYDKSGFMAQGSSSFPFVFTIPVYNNMAGTLYSSPDGWKANLSTSGTQDSTFENAIKNFPDSYKPYLRDLHKDHPNWTFKMLNTGLDFEKAASIEMKSGAIQKEAYRLKNSNGNYEGAGDANWYRPNLQATKFYMDPRNWLNESYVFMFEDLTYNSVFTENVVQKVLNQKSLISGKDSVSGKTYASEFVEAGSKANVNPVYLASLAVQEVSANNISGYTFEYNGTTYSGLYNMYNIGAASGEANPLRAGLVYASGGFCTICNNSSSSTNSSTSNTTKETPVVGNISNIGVVNGSYVKGFNVGTTISTLKAKDGNISYSNSDIIKTGTVISTGNASYTAVVMGDVTGDGQINSADLLKLRQHLLGKTSLNGAYLEAAKVSGSSINSASLLKLRQHLLGKTTISQR